jgi:Reverse transcriptase (RNA-dependent DNA polymerase)/Endonuclease-reverse transcriptase
LSLNLELSNCPDNRLLTEKNYCEPKTLYDSLSKSSLSIYFQNVNRARRKTNELFLAASECNHDIIMLVETNFNTDISDTEILDDRYVIYRCDRSSLSSHKSNGGGVLIAIDRDYKSERLLIGGESIEQIWVKLTVSKKNYLLCCVYLPPDCSIDSYHTHIKSVETCFNSSNVNDNILICGDFNLPNVSWSQVDTCADLLPNNVTSDKDSITVDGMASCNLVQINKIPNIRNVFLDLFFCNFNDDTSVNICETPLLNLDVHHQAYEIAIDVGEIIFEEPRDTKKYFNFSKADYSAISQFLDEIDWNSLLAHEDVDTCVDLFYGKLSECFEKFVPKSRPSAVKKRHPWQTRELINLQNRKNKAWKRKKSPLYKNLRTKYHDLHRHCYSSYLRSIENGIKTDPKSFFSFANHKRKITGFPKSMKLGDKFADGSKNSSELFADFFESVYAADDDSHISDTPSMIDSGLTSLQLTPSDIEAALKGIDVNKGPGDDGIPPQFVKRCANSLKSPLLRIFNLSLSKGIFPSIWKNSFLVPIFKSGKRNDIANYRGVAILSCFAKLFEVIAYGYIFFSVKSVIPTSQHGFVHGRSTVTNLIEFISFVTKKIEAGAQIDAIYTDFSKAFDKVNHRLLLLKLSRMGFGGSFLDWIASYLTGRWQFVKIGNACSRLFPVKSGVPQGSHLGPLLFILFLSDVISCFKSVRVLLYADDIKIFFPVMNQEDHEIAQTDLDAFSQWCTQNKMELNLSKCKVMSFTRSLYSKQFSYKLSGIFLQKVESIEDLGVMLDTKLSFVPHINATIAKALRMLGFIKRIGKEFKDPYTLITLFNSYVRSKLEYACIIWDPCFKIHSDRIENVQRRFLRFALRNLGWNHNLSLPSYCSRCRLVSLDLLYVRRRTACILFVCNVLVKRLDCPSILSALFFRFYRHNIRTREMLREDCHRTIYGSNEPVNRCIKYFNSFSCLFEFDISIECFKKKVLDILRKNPCSCCDKYFVWNSRLILRF